MHFVIVCADPCFYNFKYRLSTLRPPFPRGCVAAMTDDSASSSRVKSKAEHKKRVAVINMMSPKSKKQYHGLTKYSDKAAFRDVYEADHSIKSIETVKKDEQHDEKTEWKHCTYEPLAIIIKKEGGKDDPEAVRAGCLIAKKRLAAGFPMVAYNEDAERIEYLYGKKGFSEKFIKRKSMASTAVLDDPLMLPLITKAKTEGLEELTSLQLSQAELMLAKYVIPVIPAEHFADMGAGPVRYVTPERRSAVSRSPPPHGVGDAVAVTYPLRPVPKVVPPPLKQEHAETQLDDDTQPVVVLLPRQLVVAAIPKPVPPPADKEAAAKREFKKEPGAENPDNALLGLGKPEDDRAAVAPSSAAAAAASATAARTTFLKAYDALLSNVKAIKALRSDAQTMADGAGKDKKESPWWWVTDFKERLTILRFG